jgi:diguanylate cyclase (GGDEF)-like protein/PAS domain S-box-containing protein
VERIRRLTVLYDLALASGSETHAGPLLEHTLQRLVFHTAIPYAVFLSKDGIADDVQVPVRVECAIGLRPLRQLMGSTLKVPRALLEGVDSLIRLRSLPDMPDVLLDGGRMVEALRLRVGATDTILLLSPGRVEVETDLEHLLEPVLRNLDKNLFLCRSSEAYTRHLETEHRSKLRLISKVYECLREGILITDTQAVILDANPAASEITGYSHPEMLGNTPRLWRSALHDETFYREMWQHLLAQGWWRGEVWNRRKNGEVYPASLTIDALNDDEGIVRNYVAVFNDISGQKESQERLEFLAHHDALTNLPNRLLFGDRLSHALARAERDGSKLAVLFLDLDRFKNVNDSLGHAAGDRLLQEAAARLGAVLRKEDTVARLGGDEFAILLESIEEETVTNFAERINAVIAQPFELDRHTFFIGVTIGISLYPRDGNTATELTSNADAAMYQAKAQGRNAFSFYTRKLTEEALQRLQIEADLRVAIQQDQLQMYYQPLVELDTGRVIGAEALMRWIHPELGFIPPDRFIPVAEDCGLIIQMGEWALGQACNQLVAWQKQGLPVEFVAVNVSGRQLLQEGFASVVMRALKDSGLPPACLELEITESFFVQDTPGAMNVLSRLREVGIQLAVDDFGTGYSGLAQLKRMPIDKLKIDRSFVRDLPNDLDDAVISRMIIALGKSLGLKVLAEGIETTAQRDFLAIEGAQQAQGWLFGKPLPADEFARFAAQSTPRTPP